MSILQFKNPLPAATASDLPRCAVEVTKLHDRKREGEETRVASVGGGVILDPYAFGR
jgi:hypothetical protein